MNALKQMELAKLHYYKLDAHLFCDILLHTIQKEAFAHHCYIYTLQISNTWTYHNLHCTHSNFNVYATLTVDTHHISIYRVSLDQPMTLVLVLSCWIEFQFNMPKCTDKIQCRKGYYMLLSLRELIESTIDGNCCFIW